MTSTLWLSPIVSSRVSEVRTIARPSAVKRANELVDFLLGADVEAARRMIEDENPGLGVQPFRQHDFLLVAAGKVEAERV